MTPEAAALPRREILYVDDEDFNLLLMDTLLSHRPNLRLFTAKSEAEALDVAPRISPQLLLLDINLAAGDGVRLLKRLRERAGWDDIPAIALTGERDFDLRGTGFCEVWVKPLLLFHCLSRLDHWLLRTTEPLAPLTVSL